MSSIATNLSDYLSKVESLAQDFDDVWFRGVRNESYELIPSVFRTTFDKADESLLFNLFYIGAPTLVTRDVKDGWEWLSLMQHYGLATRLLDWTESSLSALFFALENCDTLPAGDCSPCVYLLDPLSWNNTFYQSPYVQIADSPTLYPWIIPEMRFPPESEAGNDGQTDPFNGLKIEDGQAGKFPVAIYAKATHQRIVAQRGAFTLHGEYTGCLSKTSKEKGFGRLKQIQIDVKKEHDANGWLDQLDQAGVNRSTLFPELSGLADFLRWKYKKR